MKCLESISIRDEEHSAASLNLRLKILFFFSVGRIKPEIEAFFLVQVENQQTSGGELEYRGSVPHGVEKVRLDAWLAGQLARISRARVQSSIRQGLILVNGEPVNKVYCIFPYFTSYIFFFFTIL